METLTGKNSFIQGKAYMKKGANSNQFQVGAKAEPCFFLATPVRK